MNNYKNIEITIFRNNSLPNFDDEKLISSDHQLSKKLDIKVETLIHSLQDVQNYIKKRNITDYILTTKHKNKVIILYTSHHSIEMKQYFLNNNLKNLFLV